MSGDHELELQIPGSPKNTTAPNSSPSKSRNLQQWIMISLCTFVTLAGQTIATLLGRFYYDQGGNSKWLPTLVTSAGLPILLPILFSSSPISSLLTPDTRKVALIYTALGLAATVDNLMYSYALLYLPVSTFSLVCATQLAFNLVFSHFLNSQRCTALILNSVILLTFSAALLAVSSSGTSPHVPDSKYPLGYVLTLGASAVFALLLSLTQLTFQKVLKRDGFPVVLELLTCTSLVSSAAAAVGLFASGEWRGLRSEMEGFAKGEAWYVIVLVSIAVSWIVTGVAATWLTFAVSSLYSNVIGTLGLPIVPIFAVVFFRDSMDGVKVVAMLIAVWGFLSYIYQDYLDDSRAEKEKCSA